MNVPPTVWFNAGDGGYWRRLANVCVCALLHPNCVSRHICRQIVKRRFARLLRFKKP